MLSSAQRGLGNNSSEVINEVVQQPIAPATAGATGATRTESGGGNLREIVDGWEEIPNLVGGSGEGVLEEPAVVVVEIVEEETGLTGTLGVLLSAVTRALSPRVAQDGGPDKRIGSHVVQTKVLHQPDISFSGLVRPSPTLPEHNLYLIAWPCIVVCLFLLFFPRTDISVEAMFPRPKPPP